MRTVGLAIVVALAVGACAGRAPQPVAVVQPQDRYADCAAITAEIEANNQKVSELASEQGLKVGQNVAAGVAGLVVWPLLFAMDFQDTAGQGSRCAAEPPAISRHPGRAALRARRAAAATRAGSQALSAAAGAASASG